MWFLLPQTFHPTSPHKPYQTLCSHRKFIWTQVYLNTSFCLVLNNTVWSFHWINPQINLIFTVPYASLTWASKLTPSMHLVPPPRFHFFQSHNKITYVIAHHTRNLYFFHIRCSNTVTTFETSPNPQQYHLQVHSVTSLR